MPESHAQPEEVATLTTGTRWRWGMVCVGAVILWLGRSLGLSNLSDWIIFSFAVVGIVANLIIMRLLRLEWFRPWLAYATCVADVTLLGLAVLYLGPGGTIAVFFVVTIPWANRPNRALGIFALVSASAAYLVAASMHGLISDHAGAAVLSTESAVLLDLAIFIGVSATILTAHNDLFRRIAEIRGAISSAAAGHIQPIATVVHNDCVGQLARSLNGLLERISSAVEAVQRSADECLQLGHTLSDVTRDAIESSTRVANLADRLAKGLRGLECSAETGQKEGEDAAQEAKNLQSRTERKLGNIKEFEETAAFGRDRVAGATEAVSAIATDVSRASSKVEELGALSRRIGSSALAIAKIARHTHVLALNAAIEAAHAEEQGAEFAVVAERVRTLAGEAGRSARDVGDLVNEVNAGVTAVASALAAGKEKIADISHGADEARNALTCLLSGASNAAEFLSAATEASQVHVNRAREFANTMSQFAATSATWSAELQEASVIASDQTKLMSDLDRITEQLAHSAQMLRQEVAGLSNAGV